MLSHNRALPECVSEDKEDDGGAGTSTVVPPTSSKHAGHVRTRAALYWLGCGKIRVSLSLSLCHTRDCCGLWRHVCSFLLLQQPISLSPFSSAPLLGSTMVQPASPCTMVARRWARSDSASKSPLKTRLIGRCLLVCTVIKPNYASLRSANVGRRDVLNRTVTGLGLWSAGTEW